MGGLRAILPLHDRRKGGAGAEFDRARSPPFGCSVVVRMVMAVPGGARVHIDIGEEVGG